MTVIANYRRLRTYTCVSSWAAHRAAAPAAMQITPSGQFAVGFATARAMRGTQHGASQGVPTELHRRLEGVHGNSGGWGVYEKSATLFRRIRSTCNERGKNYFLFLKSGLRWNKSSYKSRFVIMKQGLNNGLIREYNSCLINRKFRQKVHRSYYVFVLKGVHNVWMIRTWLNIENIN